MQRLKTSSKSVSLHEGSLILVNGAYPYAPCDNLPLATVDPQYPDIKMAPRAANLLRQAIASVAGGAGILPVSGYRDTAEQQDIWDDTMREKGPVFTRKFVAAPGHSEHHTGLAIDLGYCESETAPDFICPAFPYDGVCGAFRKAALRHGFVERYPAGKEHITGIAHEPWHFRYVGFPHSMIMQAHGFCLEEYIDFIQGEGHKTSILYFAGDYKIEISYTNSADATVLIDPYTQISGDNVDGFILTKWSRCNA